MTTCTRKSRDHVITCNHTITCVRKIRDSKISHTLDRAGNERWQKYTWLRRTNIMLKEKCSSVHPGISVVAVRLGNVSIHAYFLSRIIDQKKILNDHQRTWVCWHKKSTTVSAVQVLGFRVNGLKCRLFAESLQQVCSTTRRNRKFVRRQWKKQTYSSTRIDGTSVQR